jgi:hypothetical protein
MRRFILSVPYFRSVDNELPFSHDDPGMDEKQLTRPCLESLTTGELVRMADSLGIDIPSGLERVFIIGELLDAAANEDVEIEDGEADVLEGVEFSDSAPLPKQYNITFIEALIRDPLWVFRFWEVKGSDKALFEGEEDFGGYCLRVNPLGNGGGVQREHSFTVPVGNDDTAWYLGFPPESSAGNTRYQVELCACRGPDLVALAVSRLFTMPRLQSSIRDSCPGPLIRLSGADDFGIIRNADRLSRARYGIVTDE